MNLAKEFPRFPGLARRAAASPHPCERELVHPRGFMGFIPLLSSAEQFLVGEWAADLSPVRCHDELRVGSNTVIVPRTWISFTEAVISSGL